MNRFMMFFVWMTVCFLMFPAAIDAHADLYSSTPANGAVLSSAPSEVELLFSTVIDEQVYKMDVLNDKGESIAIGKPSISLSRDKLTVSVLHSANGLVTVPYSVISKDGHPIEGSISFTIELSEQTVAPMEVADKPASIDNNQPQMISGSTNEAIQKPEDMNEKHDTSEQSPSVLSSFIKSAYLLSLLLLAGTLLWNFKGFKIPFTAHMQLIHLDLLVLFTWSQARNFTRVFDEIPWQDLFLRTEVGQFWTAALVITTLGLYIINRNRFIDLAWAGAILLTKSLNSHAIAAATPSVTVGLNFIHLLFAALWLAGLFYTLILWKKGLAHTFIPTFSKMALLSIIVLTVSGSIYAWLLTPELSALWTTEWGYWMIAKLVVVIAVFFTGALIRKHMKKNESLKEIRYLYFDASLATTILIIVGVLTQLSPAQ
ncbi:copper resistance CopC/CopD family protein [Paenisporosarcina sp. NPDC076898]|uniref:copper resistance CopC/CopD family protein n=1 Tax=unclassified Paenisporosarcina TaxID=2642018 RepID=UPI003CFF97AE